MQSQALVSIVPAPQGCSQSFTRVWICKVSAVHRQSSSSSGPALWRAEAGKGSAPFQRCSLAGHFWAALGRSLCTEGRWGELGDPSSLKRGSGEFQSATQRGGSPARSLLLLSTGFPEAAMGQFPGFSLLEGSVSLRHHLHCQPLLSDHVS